MKTSKQYMEDHHKQFRDDIMYFSGIQFIPVSDAKAHIVFAVKEAQKEAIEETVNRFKDSINSWPDWAMMSDEVYKEIEKELTDKIE